MRKPRLRVVVTDGETRAALAAVRSLAAAGHDVHVTGPQQRCLAGRSRGAVTALELPDPARQPEAWCLALEEIVTALSADVVLPVSDTSLAVLYLDGHHERLPVAGPSPEAFAVASDKYRLLHQAEELGFDVPATVLVDDPLRLPEVVADFGYPCVVKSRRSRFLVDGRWQSGDVIVVRDRSRARSLPGEPALADGALVQEFLPGGSEGIFILAQEGRPLVSFAHKRVRDYPPAGGVSVVRQSIEPDPKLLDASERLLADMAYTGAAMVEFRRTFDGRAALMELNPRLWGSLQLAIDAGIDFPALIVDQFMGKPVPPREQAIGIRSRWLLGDLDHLLTSLRHPEVRQLTGLSVGDVVTGFARSFGDRPEVLRAGDLRPFWYELAGWLQGRLGRHR